MEVDGKSVKFGDLAGIGVVDLLCGGARSSPVVRRFEQELAETINVSLWIGPYLFFLSSKLF